MHGMSIRLLLLLALASLGGCASHHSPEIVGDPYGFFSGLWHGLVSPYAILTNIVSWFFGLVNLSFFQSVEIVGRPNTGFFYYLGFAIGLFSYSGGAAR